MKESKTLTKWTLHHMWVILLSYIISMFMLLMIHGWFGFSMKDTGTYLSNALMHIASGAILALGTGILQKELLKEYINVSSFWILSLIIGFVVAESLAGLILWKLEIYRGLINVFNSTDHLAEAAIFATAGLISGILQSRLLKSSYLKVNIWIIINSAGWGLFILSAYTGLFAFLLGPFLYGILTGSFIIKNRIEKGV
jgi:hypothetical protein